MKITAKQARERLSELLDRAARGEEVVILRRGKPVIRLAPARAAKPVRLPDLREFRASIRARGATLTEHLLKEREEARY
jgi:prevent-host-death family protein